MLEYKNNNLLNNTSYQNRCWKYKETNLKFLNVLDKSNIQLFEELFEAFRVVIFAFRQECKHGAVYTPKEDQDGLVAQLLCQIKIK